MAAMKPVLLVFDVPANIQPADCTLGIVDLNGRKVMEKATAPKNGRIEASADNLKPTITGFACTAEPTTNCWLKTASVRGNKLSWLLGGNHGWPTRRSHHSEGQKRVLFSG